jgi:uncharacterized protein (TIGR02231 family)
MKKILFAALCALPLWSGSAQALPESPAQPASALFSPDQIRLSVEERLRPETLPGLGRGFFVLLPAAAEQSSFAATADGSPVAAFSWLDPEKDLPAPGLPSFPRTPASRPEEENNPGRRALLQKLLALQDKADSLAADLETLDLRINLWRERGKEDQEVKAGDLLKLDSAIKDLLPGLFTARSSAERLQENNNLRLQEAESALSDYDQKHRRRMVFLPSEIPDNKSVLLRYAYTLPGSCRTAYDLNALPAENSLSIAQSASLVQSSGFAWKDVQVFISTSGHDPGLDPLLLFPWQIRLNAQASPPPFPRQNLSLAVRAQNLTLEEASAPEEKDFAPESEEKGVFRLWSLGKRNLDADIAVTVPLAFNKYPANFHYTLRPSRSPKGILSAVLATEQPLEMPSGRARFFVDAVFVGEKNLSLNGTEAVLHFGSDPQVTASRVDRKRAGGEQGFLSKEQTVFWHWDFIVGNSRNRPVEAWIEDPLPDALDEAVSLKVVSSPKPEEEILDERQGGVKIYRWKISLAPGEVRTISHLVTVLAPADQILDPGRDQ